MSLGVTAQQVEFEDGRVNSGLGARRVGVEVEKIELGGQERISWDLSEEVVVRLTCTVM